MKTVTLGQTSLRPSVLGFGCVSLTMHPDRASAVRLLETAFDHGVTHFDVARLYGFGQAEGILGEFLRGKRERVTVTTKFGLAPSPAMAKHRRLVGIARRVVRRFGFLRRLVRRRSGQLFVGGAFSPAEAAASLETSLRELGTDYVDVLLLHEGTSADAGREDLLAYLDAQVKRGTVRHYGLGTAFNTLAAGGDDFAARLPAGHSVLQFDSNAATRNVARVGAAGGRGIITHSAVNLTPRLVDFARADAGRAKEWGDRIGADPSDPAAVAGVLLRYAVGANPAGPVLFATTRAAHVKANVAAVAAGPLAPDQAAAIEEFAAAATAAAGRGA